MEDNDRDKQSSFLCYGKNYFPLKSFIVRALSLVFAGKAGALWSGAPYETQH